MPVPISSCSYLGPSHLPKPTRLRILQPPTAPTAIQLQSSVSMEYLTHRAATAQLSNPSWGRGPWYCSLALDSAKKGTTLLLPQGETLPYDCHLLAQFLPGSGVSRQLPSHPHGPLVVLSRRTWPSLTAPQQPGPPTPPPSSALRRTWGMGQPDRLGAAGTLPTHPTRGQEKGGE